MCVCMFVCIYVYLYTARSRVWLPSEGKRSRWSRVVVLRHVKEPQVEIRASEQNMSEFSRSL